VHGRAEDWYGKIAGNWYFDNAKPHDTLCAKFDLARIQPAPSRWKSAHMAGWLSVNGFGRSL
jgi:hypothetical protein